MNNYAIGNYKRVSKRAARRLYNNGEIIRICAVKLSPVNYYGMYADAYKEGFTNIANDGFNNIVARNREFETVVNCFEYYNCNNETGRYAAFYVKEGCAVCNTTK